jgi:hypothetical protein
MNDERCGEDGHKEPATVAPSGSGDASRFRSAVVIL